MKFEEVSVASTKEILANDHYVAIPVTLDFTSVTATENSDKIVKAGTPLKTASGGWVVSNDASATGILLHDVRESDPNGALVIHGTINEANAESASGLTYSSISIAGIRLV